MYKTSTTISVLVGLFLLLSCNNKNEVIILFSNPAIEYSGRIDESRNEGVDLYWSGTSVKLSFEGDSIWALLKDEGGNNYYNVIVDLDNISILRPDTVQKYFLLASNLNKGKHTIEIFKRTEWEKGKTTFLGFKIKGDAKVLPRSAAKKRKIEFYGDSMTAGYAIEDDSGNDCPDSTYTNNYLSYAYLTARNFDADYRCICRSGIGVLISWFPLTMPEMYDRLNPADSASKWDFKKYTPDIVVINLFQNDAWLLNMPEREEFKLKFGKKTPDDDLIINAYNDFVANIRRQYPQANIICTVGNMDASMDGSKWIGFIKKAVNSLNDKKIFTYFMPYKGTPGHPNVREHEKMSKSLCQFIETNINW